MKLNGYPKYNDRFDPKALIPVLIMAITEFEVFTLPKKIALIAGRDAWLSAILGGILISIFTFVLIKLAARFPEENYFQYGKKIWGKPVMYIIYVASFLFWLFYLVILLKNLIEANQLYFLRRTPILPQLAFLLLGAIWLSAYGLANIIRFFQILLPFLLIPLAVSIGISLPRLEIGNLLPVLSKGIIPVIKAALLYMGYFSGIEIILFIGPFLKSQSKTIKPALIGVNVLNVIVFFQTLTTIGILGAGNIGHTVWPSMTLLEVIEFPGFNIERYELFLTLPWLFGAFSSLCLYLYLLTYGIIQVCSIQIKNKKIVLYLVVTMSLLISYLIPNYSWVIHLRIALRVVASIIIFILPLLSLSVAIMRNKRGDHR